MEAQRLAVDVVVIGTGGAGLRAAIALQDQGRNVLLVGKRPKADAHTVLAAGGINAALATLDYEDTWAIHAAEALPQDPWGQPYQYSVPGANGQPFALFSLGGDGKRGGEGIDADVGQLPP